MKKVILPALFMMFFLSVGYVFATDSRKEVVEAFNIANKEGDDHD